MARDQPAGVATPYAGRVINNDYLYPKKYVPGPFRRTKDFGGLVRGWLYPMDVNTLQTEQETILALEESSAGGEISASRRAELAQQLAADVAASLGTGTVSTETTVRNRAVEEDVFKYVRYSEGKQFQFNPAAIDLSLEFVNSAPAQSLQEGGNASTLLIGTGSTGIKMYFDRSREVYAASQGNRSQRVDPVFAHVGVQKDIWDCFRIMLGTSATANFWDEQMENSLGNIEQIAGDLGERVVPPSATNMLGKIFDLGISGWQAYNQPIAIYFNANLVIIGFVSGLAVSYAAFNANLVPTMASLDVQLQLISTTSESGVDAFNGLPPLTGGIPGVGTEPASSGGLSGMADMFLGGGSSSSWDPRRGRSRRTPVPV